MSCYYTDEADLFKTGLRIIHATQPFLRHVGRGLRTLHSIVHLVLTVDYATLSEHYTLLRSTEESTTTNKKGSSTFGYSRGTNFSLWCFTPGVAWRALKATGLRSVVLASGTLHPLSQFRSDFGPGSFPVGYEGEHVIDAPKQVLCR